MGFEIESNLIIFIMFALLVLLVYHGQIKKNTPNYNKDNEGYMNSSVNILNDDYYEKPKNNKNKKKYKSNKHEKMLGQNFNMHNLVNAMSKNRPNVCRDTIRSRHHKQKLHHKHVNTDFTEMQYHKDYNDVITAINNLTPQKELFNMGFLPVIESKPNKGNVKSLVKLFLDKINNEIKNNVQEYLHTNSGWNDMGKRKREKSGFEEQMEELGLPGSIYNESAGSAPINLVKIDKTEQFTTDDQIRFTIYIIIQKENVKDQMVLQIQFFMEREDLSGNRDDRANFFEKGLSTCDDLIKIDPDQVVIIEQIFTLGYLTDETHGKTKMDKFHNYGDIQHQDGTIDQAKVIKMMLIKHKERENELNSFMSTVDDDTKEIHNVYRNNSYDQ
jgi:hypothetical protein